MRGCRNNSNLLSSPTVLDVLAQQRLTSTEPAPPTSLLQLSERPFNDKQRLISIIEEALKITADTEKFFGTSSSSSP
jgi:hypothetical protein